jgi:transcriptional regulator with XRE-family HTH domain
MSRTSVKLRAVSEHLSFPSADGVVPPEGPLNNPGMPKKGSRPYLQALGGRIKAMRDAKGWSRTVLARRAHVTVATLRGCEEGTKVTHSEKLQAIAHALGVTTRRFESDEKDPRVRHWTDEDYEIGGWYHNAPRALKNQIWALQEVPEAGHTLMDPQFAPLLEHWATLSQEQKVFVLNALDYIRRVPNGLPNATDTTTGGALHALAATDRRIREPVR